MDPVQRSPQTNAEGEDLGMLIYKSGRVVKQLLSSIGRGFSNLGNAILALILFLFKNILWILAGTAIGMFYGIYILNKTGTNYYSEMTVKTNYNSAQALYKTMDYLNALISNGDTKELAGFFNITLPEAERLTNFSAQTVESEIITADIYRDQFLREGRSNVIRQDTFWVRTLGYKDFKDALTKLDYPYHKVVVISTNPNLFGKLQKGIIDHISGNKLLQDLRTTQQATNTQEEKWIAESITKLDTLRQAYNARLLKGESPSIPANQMTVLSQAPNIKPPELELYNKMLELIDELDKVRRRSVTEHEIIEVYSPFNPAGQKISFFQQSIIKFSTFGLVTTILILLLILSYKSLLAYDKKNLAKRSQQPLV